MIEMIDNSNLKQYRELFNHIDVVLKEVEAQKGEVTVNRAYYDKDALTVNFTINKKKHTFKSEIDNTSSLGYNFYLDGEHLSIVI